ncbi:ZIP zinc/iron transport family [Parathielavia hyrcaniae]|uniref:ZIP zinc/iron transport family n=1 Tax=Parathielavia hyrcaniae TaxID=113614 RepID=A0AAN6T7N2_9PEZI|nr:ZIP zinc/iron transport family [Parathielavia hyrcaniae]
MHQQLYRHILAGRDEGDEASAVPACEISPANTDYWGLRIASIFVIFAGSAIGALVPVFLARTSRFPVPKLCFFIAKYFGTGVILATAWMHLLSPASENLRDECLANVLPDYDWAMAIGLMTVMVMFLLEIMVSQFDFGFGSAHSHVHGRDRQAKRAPQDVEAGAASDKSFETSAAAQRNAEASGSDPVSGGDFTYPAGGGDHLGHQREHIEGDEHANYAAQLTAIFVLEFGVIFHSVFIGLTLAVTENFVILFVVLVFHQTFEGLGLGARLGTATWPPGSRRWTPYLLGLLYAVSTPLAIGMGLVASHSLALEAATSKVVNGVFDAISGGILIYTALVELVAHEFMFNPEMRKASLGTQLFAYGCVALGVGLMALLAKWA